jgi:FAD/FMN-containing dehydrogenase
MTLHQAQFTRFLDAYGGEAIQPAHPDFAEARAAAVWNGDITRQPALIIRPRTHEDVARAVRSARAHGLDFTVRGGGHGLSGNAVAEDAVMLDLSRIAGISVDPVARLATVGGGASWAPLDAATTAHGLAVVGGTVSHTGVAGLTLGGGIGWLTAAQGLSCDNLVQATVVTADGRVVTASQQEHPDLFWGLRGAGANFGVVTEFVFALHELNPVVDLGMFLWPVEEAREPLRAIRGYMEGLPAGTGAAVVGMSAPPAPFVPAEHHGRTVVGVLVVGSNGSEQHGAAVAPLRDLRPLVQFVTQIPYTALQQMLDESLPWGINAYEKGLNLDDLPDEAIDVVLDWLPRKTSALSQMPMFALGGRFAEVPDDATAFSGSRSTRWALTVVGVTPDRESLLAEREWARGFWQALRPYARSDGAYINFLGEADPHRVRASYGETKYRRLAALKAEWDPDNVFRHNPNIPPAEAAVPTQRQPDPEAAALPNT